MDRSELERIAAVFAAYSAVGGVWLFGSRARGRATARSDLDLAVDPLPGRADEVRARRLDMLADLVAAGYDDVDLVILDRDDPVLRLEAIGANRLVCAAPGYDAPEALVRALREHDDGTRLRRIQREALYERLMQRA